MENCHRKDLFRQLGYDVDLVGSLYFLDIVDDVCQSLELFSDEKKARKLIPVCCLEYGHFYYEVGLNNFNNDLASFVGSRNITEENEKLNLEVFGTTEELSVNDSIIGFAKYLNAKKEIAVEKSLVKSNNC